MYKPEALIVLNGGVKSANGLVMPNNDTAGRIDYALAMAADRSIGTVAMVGRDAEAMHAYADRILTSSDGIEVKINDESRDTVGNAHFTKLKLAEPNKWDEIEVITSDYHAKRAAWVFGRVFGYSIPTFRAPTSYDSDMLRKLTRRETALTFMDWGVLLGVTPRQDEKRERRLYRLSRYSDSLPGFVKRGISPRR